MKKGNTTSKPFSSEKLFPSRSLLKSSSSSRSCASHWERSCWHCATPTVLLQTLLHRVSGQQETSIITYKSLTGTSHHPHSLQLPSQDWGGSPSSVETFFFDDIGLQQQVTHFLPHQEHKRWSFLVLFSFGCRAECFCYPYLGLLGIHG